MPVWVRLQERSTITRQAKAWICCITVEKNMIQVGFGVLTALVMKSSLFCGITPFSPFKGNRCFGGTCRLHLQGQRISQVRNQHEADYTVLCPRRQNSSVWYKFTLIYMCMVCAFSYRTICSFDYFVQPLHMSQRYWVFGLCPSSGFFLNNNEKHNISETGSVSVLRWGKTPTLLGPLERANLNHLTTDAIIH
jgi:hypothetical protein